MDIIQYHSHVYLEIELEMSYMPESPQQWLPRKEFIHDFKRIIVTHLIHGFCQTNHPQIRD